MPRWFFWLFWTAVTVASWGIWAILSRFLPANISPAAGQALSTIGLAPIILALWAMKDTPPPGNRRLGIWLAFGSGIISCLGNVAYYAALGNAKAAAVIPLTALYPAVTILLAVPLLKERFTLVQFLGMGSALAAIVLFNAPTEGASFSPWILLSLIPIVLWGVTLLMQKVATNHISARLSGLWFLLAFVPIAAIILVYEPLPSGLTLKVWSLEAALGFTLAFGNLTILLAFAYGGKASIVGPLAGLYPVVSLPIALLLLDEELRPHEAWGILFSLIAVALLSYAPDPKPIEST